MIVVFKNLPEQLSINVYAVAKIVIHQFFTNLLIELKSRFKRRKNKTNKMSQMELEAEVEFFSRVVNLPVVNSAIGFASDAYHNAKVRHNLFSNHTMGLNWKNYIKFSKRFKQET